MDCEARLCFKKGLVRLLYNLLFPVFFLVTSPRYLWRMIRRGNWCENFGQRFGFYDRELKEWAKQQPIFWLHAVSVGEVNLAIPLLKEMEKRLPDFQFVVSTTTSTGMGQLQRGLSPTMRAVYYPVDLPWVVARAFRVFRPRCIALVEVEIWPNFIWRAAKRNVPICLVNARLSDRSFRGYGRFGFLFRPIFSRFELVCAQTEDDANRWRALGCRDGSVQTCGNLKFDAVDVSSPPKVDFGKLLNDLGVASSRRVLLGASTHIGEEKMLGEIYLRLRQENPELFLVIVPRHMERCVHVSRELSSVGIKCQLRTKLSDTPAEACDCLLVDTTGELLDIYRLAEWVVMGKSFEMSPGGGQNPIEPAALGKPVFFGPRMGNFKGIVQSLLSSRGACRVSNFTELERVLKTAMDSDQFKKMGRAASMVVVRNRGTLVKTVEFLHKSVTKTCQKTCQNGLDGAEGIS
tara:strand:+ start:6098 stop:7483 length:1386 start_codon:yes stop_codon:yes gene_type:complete